MSKLSYDALAIDGLKEVLKQVASCCSSLDIDFFIVGAIARNIWFVSHGEHSRGTKDIDFAVYVPSKEKYRNLRKALIKEHSYRVSTENAFSLMSPDDKHIDLLPFGEIEQDGQVMIEGKGLTTVKLDGFHESYKLGIAEVQLGDEKYKVCTIPSVVILKLIAYDDRPDRRIKDVLDINSIFKHYPDIESELIWNDHFDLYHDEREHKEVALIALGREMKKILNENLDLKDRIISIIDKALNMESTFLDHMIENAETETIAMKKSLLENIKLGLME